MDEPKQKVKVVICMPVFPARPHPRTLEALKAEVPFLDAAEFDHGLVHEIGCPYISAARATMLRKALDAKAEIVVFLDSDVSWAPGDLTKLIQTEGDVVSGTYRFKKGPSEQQNPPDKDEEYMGNFAAGPFGRPFVRQTDGAIKATAVPAGFLKITRHCVNVLMEKFPDLNYGEHCAPHFDLFNHGVHKRVWYGEDYAFSRRWVEDCGQDIWIVPDLNLTHWSGDGAASGGTEKPYHGNMHQFLMRQPGGSESANPVSPETLMQCNRFKASAKSPQ